MKRRRLLSAFAGGFAALGGCLAGNGRDPPPSAPSETGNPGTPTLQGTDASPGTTDATIWDGSTTDDTPGTAAGVRIVTVTPAIVALNSPDSIGTYGDRDEQFVVATVEARSSGPERNEFALDTSEGSFDPVERIGYAGTLWDRDEPYEPGNAGWIAFRVPKPVDAENGVITWPDGEHSLSDDARERLSRPPTDFEVRALDGPDAVELGEEAVLTLTVENVGESDGTFVGALNRTGPWIAYTPAARIDIDVPAGETASRRHAHTPDERGSDDAQEIPPMTFRLNWRGESVSREINVEAP